MVSVRLTLFSCITIFEILYISSVQGECSTYTGDQLKNVINMVKTLFKTYAQYVDDTSKQYPDIYSKFDDDPSMTFEQVENWVVSLLGYYSNILRQETRVDTLDATHRQQIINALKTYLQGISNYTNNNEVPGKTVLENELKSLENAI